MALGSPATVVIMTLVELVTMASTVMLSTFSPASFFSSTPVSSTKALRVPLPSSRLTTVMSCA